MECGDKSPLSKAVPRHRTPKNGVFRGRCPPLKPSGGAVRAKKPKVQRFHRVKLLPVNHHCVT